ncbi:branched-chain amino acid ABC transporter permease [Oceanotoga sp. DSM 15011]|jgi:branched-chain amino acid transport system permease protein|uniref:Amino acid/amide ABC transporter membrane protein 2 (HAAT family) n=1 Tax=Oceanotoga teriensis TaxID=515440 RepID=A0AA45HIG0_9BACT|nr:MULTISPECIES: branched-chain amino acid ABC transporter permease [Oceanotoga]MDN5342556.1 branched-chain amino acid transport system permease protein [Oceanotoga sp.]MDO7977052.1 branched-chain amino acid ABC transporter permease [Oceanotoga teriensis]PWJ92168.1 amino acid/amide ABC transporter membrane protein 2 (HAAT family) [Oceanotoga teriensis]UYO99383.1 branched-chain amino acid ABC transporter permease [Oceanotoga sp. DSM 15011]
MKFLKDIRGIIILLFTAFLFIFPLISNDFYLINILSVSFIYMVYAGSWDILSGFTGKENMGHAAFIAIGGYMLGFISSSFAIKPWLSIPLAAIFSILFGIIIGIPTLRLKGPYFALASLAIASIFEKLTISYSEVTGGEEGIFGIPFLTEGPMGSYYFMLIFAVISIGLLFYLGKSNFGLILKSIKSDEEAAKALGIETTKYKVTAFALSAMFAGMAGTVIGHFYGYIGPDIVYPLSLNTLIMSVVGGIGGIIPAALGGFFISLLTELLRGFGEWNQIIYTVILMLSVLFLPKGIFVSIGNLIKRKKSIKPVIEKSGDKN